MQPNMKLGQWTLISAVDGPGESKWNCLCDCGTKRVVKADSLNSGRSRSCGHTRKEKHQIQMGVALKGGI